MRSPPRPRILQAAIMGVLAAVAVLMLPAGAVSAAAGPAAGTRVGAHATAMILPVGPSRPVSPVQRQCRPAPQGQFAAGACVAAEETGADAGTSVFRTPPLGQGDSELESGLNPANHMEGDQSAYTGTENLARDYANPKVGGYENGYVKYDMAPEFDSEFSQYKFPYVTTSGETGSEWQIPVNMIDRFNELTVNRSWVPWEP